MVNEASSLSKLRRSEEFIKDKLSVQNIEDKTYLVNYCSESQTEK